jgi:hypothetical protein
MKHPIIALVTIITTICSLHCWSETNDVAKLPPRSLPSSPNVASKFQTSWTMDEIQVEGDKDTNGWFCSLAIRNTAILSSQVPPVCNVSIANISSNMLQCWSGLYGQTYSKIELLDANGLPVEKTAIGMDIGTRASDEKIREMVKVRFQEWVNGRARTPGFIPVRPGQSSELQFSLPQLFHITEEGRYTLNVQTCLIQRIGGEEYDPVLEITWLPKVTAVLQTHLSNAPLEKPRQMPP